MMFNSAHKPQPASSLHKTFVLDSHWIDQEYISATGYRIRTCRLSASSWCLLTLNIAYLWHFLFFLKVLYSVFTDTIVRVGDLLVLSPLCCSCFFLLLFLKNLIQEPSRGSWWWPGLYFLLETLYWCFDMSSVEIFSHFVERQGFTEPDSVQPVTRFDKWKVNNNVDQIMMVLQPWSPVPGYVKTEYL